MIIGNLLFLPPGHSFEPIIKIAETPIKKLVLETTSPFQGLPELVAYREGLFKKEGLIIEWADRDETGVKTADTSLTDVKGADPFVSHGTLFEQGKADMYNACE
jgi:hypothetical protein